MADYHDTVRTIGAAVPWPSPSGRPGRLIVILTDAKTLTNFRIECQARSLAARGYEVVVVGTEVGPSPTAQAFSPDWGPHVEFEILPADASGDLDQPPYFYSRSMIEIAARHHPFAIQATGLSTALVAIEAARRVGALPVLDFPQWASESTSWDPKTSSWRPHHAALAFALREFEVLAMRRAAAVITTGPIIARALEQLSGFNEGYVEVIRNIPDLSLSPSRAYPHLKEQAGLSPNAFAVLCQGNSETFTMLQPVIASLAHVPDIHLVIRASAVGPSRAFYRRVARRACVSNRLVLLDTVPQRDLVAASRGADVGLWTQPDISRDHHSALPADVFAYVAADLPLAAARFPEPMALLQNFGCGADFNPYEPRSIANAIEKLRSNHAFFGGRIAEAKKALFQTTVDNERRRYADIYDQLWLRVNSRFDKSTTLPLAAGAPMRVLHAPCNFANQSWTVSRAERKLGLKSELLVNYSSVFDYPADRVLGTAGGSAADYLAARRIALAAAPYDYDAYHYYFGRSLASWDDIDEFASEAFDDLKKVRGLGKPIVMTLQGCDVRLAGESNRRNAFTPCAPGRCPVYEACLSTYDAQRRRLINDILPLCDRVFYLNPELGHFVPNAAFLPYGSVDIWKVRPQPRPANVRPRILHAPSLAGVKGTDAVLAALEALSKRHAFDLVLVQNRTHEEAMAIYQTADIAIDQIFAGWYGGVSVELMAMGVPVMSYLREEDFVHAPAAMIRDLPVINIRPDHLEQDIEAALLRRAEWANIGHASRAFVEKWHDPMKIAAWLARVYADPKGVPAFDPETAETIVQ